MALGCQVLFDILRNSIDLLQASRARFSIESARRSIGHREAYREWNTRAVSYHGSRTGQQELLDYSHTQENSKP